MLVISVYSRNMTQVGTDHVELLRRLESVMQVHDERVRDSLEMCLAPMRARPEIQTILLHISAGSRADILGCLASEP